MPRPPVIEQPNYRAIFESALPYSQWIQGEDEAPAREKMESLQASITLSAATIAFLQNLDKPVHVLAFAEGWCGDVHRHVPVLEKMVAVSDRIHVRYTSREANEEAFKRFLTNGGEAVPKFVFFSDQFVECGNWGPMPSELRLIISRGKGAGNVGAARKRVGAMYDADPNCERTQDELLELFATASCTKP